MDSEKNVEYRIGRTEAALVISVALICDLISFIPGYYLLGTIVAQVLLPIVFLSAGVNFFTKKRAVPYILAWAIEVMPLLSLIPAITLESLFMIASSRKEDRKKAETEAQISK